jgi:hypothetical protein
MSPGNKVFSTFINYWRDVVQENPSVSKFVLFKLLPFVATCVCEIGRLHYTVTHLNDRTDWMLFLMLEADFDCSLFHPHKNLVRALVFYLI